MYDIFKLGAITFPNPSARIGLIYPKSTLLVNTEVNNKRINVNDVVIKQ